ncbi:MAG: uracil-DNA glycosylase family protein [Muribaculaceae bacterium]|nr:uracil-DNA glycosylase family protein [Muribaculaceae bacterium]
MHSDSPLETHPWPPYIPDGAKVLIMGTFPPQEKRWAMNFYYPNKTNDFWKIMGIIFHSDPNALYDPESGRYNLEKIKALLDANHIALHDTGHIVRRLKGNASDKFLEIVEPTDIRKLLDRMPECNTIATTGEKAARVVADLTGTDVPAMGRMVTSPDGLRIWRMPSTSRAYPLKAELKAAHYAEMFHQLGIPSSSSE